MALHDPARVAEEMDRWSAVKDPDHRRAIQNTILDNDRLLGIAAGLNKTGCPLCGEKGGITVLAPGICCTHCGKRCTDD
jgi:hypothetical protein